MTDPTNDPPDDATSADRPPPAPQPPPPAANEATSTALPPPTAPTEDERPAAKPDRPADSGWREPPWIPARDRRERPASPAAIVFGLILVVVGLWFFLDRTLGIDLPRVSWSSLWPLVLIVIGAVVLVRSFERK